MSKKLTKKQLESYVHHKYGEGVMSDAWDWVKDKASAAHKYVKDNKVISKGLTTYAETADPRFKPLAAGAALIASKLGYGRKKYDPVRPVSGRGIGRPRKVGGSKLTQGILP